MKSTTILGVSRAKRFSPNCEDADAKIFDAVVAELRARGYSVDTLCESDVTAIAASGHDVCFSMVRSVSAIEALAKSQDEGARIVNSPRHLMLNERTEITRCFERNGIPAPKSEIIRYGEQPKMPMPFWIKRGYGCAQHIDDVSYIADERRFVDIVDGMVQRGVHEFVINEHLKGDLIKFYGVAGTDFFYTCYPLENGNHTKFGNEDINGLPMHYKYNIEALHATCTRAAELLGFTVYGGDCVVDESGCFKIIDFNDWPSFSRCRDEAACAIADAVERLCEPSNDK